MDKKTLVATLEHIVAQVAKNNGIEVTEARCFVGVALRKNQDAFINAIAIPTVTFEPTE